MGGPVSSRCGGLSCLFPFPLPSVGSGRTGSVVSGEVLEGSRSSAGLSGFDGVAGHWDKSEVGVAPQP